MINPIMLDDMIIYYHRECGWVDDPRPRCAMANECPNCGKRSVLRFVTYKSTVEWEARAAQSLIIRDMGGIA
jgi:hypothetical protein